MRCGAAWRRPTHLRVYFGQTEQRSVAVDVQRSEHVLTDADAATQPLSGQCQLALFGVHSAELIFEPCLSGLTDRLYFECELQLGDGEGPLCSSSVHVG